jgi:hypothetical protein
VAPCTSYVNGRFGSTYRLHLQGRKFRGRGTSVSRWLRFTHDLHGATSQKTTFFIVTAVKTSNLTFRYFIRREVLDAEKRLQKCDNCYRSTCQSAFEVSQSMGYCEDVTKSMHVNILQHRGRSRLVHFLHRVQKLTRSVIQEHAVYFYSTLRSNRHVSSDHSSNTYTGSY